MNILLVTYYYYPELTPRAFRAHELVKEFCRLGHYVTLLLPNKSLFRQNEYLDKNLQIVYIGKLSDYETDALNITDFPKAQQQKIRKLIPDALKEQLRKYFVWQSEYFFPIKLKPFIKDISKQLRFDETKYDLIISNAWPIECHIGVAKAMVFNKKLRNCPATVAEYGDPFSTYPEKFFFGYYLVDWFIGRMFKFFTIPTYKATSSYRLFKRRDKIIVLPQAFNLENYRLSNYVPNKFPHLAYSGSFFNQERNPGKFILYLNSINRNFLFTIFTIKEAKETENFIEQFKISLGDRFRVIYNQRREDIINELSKMDFILNFDNSTKNMVPSKLIDYAIAKRPICSVSTSKFDPTVFNEFMNGNYKNRLHINLADYDIKKVAKKFLELK